MIGSKLWLFVGILMFLAGCGGGAVNKGAIAVSPAGGDARAIASTADGAPSSVPAAEATSDDGRARSSWEQARPESPRPESRPGLGTEFGESRSSRVRDVAFVRSSSSPFATAVLHYNDRRGVDALAQISSRRSLGRGLSAAGAVTVSVRDEDGSALEAVRVGDRTLVVGSAGQRYTIVLENHTSQRFEAVATVDGLDVVSGKAGSFENRGYVLMPFAKLEIEGFRTSMASVAAFRFASVSESYAARTGDARNVGVIGVALFDDRDDPFVPGGEAHLRDTASPFPADPRFAQPPR